MPSEAHRIEKSILLSAPRSRVWRAIANSHEFGTWFGVALDGELAPGLELRGKIVPTKVDATVAASQKPYEGMPFHFVVDRLEPERVFSFRWHPYGVDPEADFSTENTTLVLFELTDAPTGTRLTLTESGFDALPPERRAKAFAMNDQGWTAQMTLIEKYLRESP